MKSSCNRYSYHWSSKKSCGALEGHWRRDRNGKKERERRKERKWNERRAGTKKERKKEIEKEREGEEERVGEKIWSRRSMWSLKSGSFLSFGHFLDMKTLVRLLQYISQTPFIVWIPLFWVMSCFGIIVILENEVVMAVLFSCWNSFRCFYLHVFIVQWKHQVMSKQKLVSIDGE